MRHVHTPPARAPEAKARCSQKAGLCTAIRAPRAHAATACVGSGGTAIAVAWAASCGHALRKMLPARDDTRGDTRATCARRKRMRHNRRRAARCSQSGVMSARSGRTPCAPKRAHHARVPLASRFIAFRWRAVAPKSVPNPAPPSPLPLQPASTAAVCPCLRPVLSVWGKRAYQFRESQSVDPNSVV